jgi:hypothetical protein
LRMSRYTYQGILIDFKLCLIHEKKAGWEIHSLF